MNVLCILTPCCTSSFPPALARVLAFAGMKLSLRFESQRDVEFMDLCWKVMLGQGHEALQDAGLARESLADRYCRVFTGTSRTTLPSRSSSRGQSQRHFFFVIARRVQVQSHDNVTYDSEAGRTHELKKV